MLKSSQWIKDQAEQFQLLNPFIPYSVRDNVISYGLGPYGYDIRLDRVYRQAREDLDVVDPRRMQDEYYYRREADQIVLAPHSYILGKSVEYFQMPKNVLALVTGKSTYARCGIIVNVTPIEPEWSGYLTISISNISGKPVVLYSMQGIAQVLFFEGDENPIFSYKDINGKYNEQKEITLPK